MSIFKIPIFRFTVYIEANYVRGDDQITYAEVTVIAFSIEQAEELARKEILKDPVFKKNGIHCVRRLGKKEDFVIPRVEKIRRNPED